VNLHHTGLGYEYVRDRAGGEDVTVYVHQLVAILGGADPEDVFDEDVDVHHRNHIPWDNRSANLDLEDSRDHRCAHLQDREVSA